MLFRAVAVNLTNLRLLSDDCYYLWNRIKIDLIKPENYNLLLQDLNTRTGLDINRIEVGKINFMRDTAEIKIYYYNGMNNYEEFTGFNNE